MHLGRFAAPTSVKKGMHNSQTLVHECPLETFEQSEEKGEKINKNERSPRGSKSPRDNKHPKEPVKHRAAFLAAPARKPPATHKSSIINRIRASLSYSRTSKATVQTFTADPVSQCSNDVVPMKETADKTWHMETVWHGEPAAIAQGHVSQTGLPPTEQLDDEIILADLDRDHISPRNVVPLCWDSADQRPPWENLEASNVVSPVAEEELPATSASPPPTVSWNQPPADLVLRKVPKSMIRLRPLAAPPGTVFSEDGH